MDYNSADYATDAAAASAAVATAGTLAIGWIVFWAIVGVINLIFLIWWILMLIDVSKRNIPEKNTWLIILIVGFFIPFGLVITTLLYYFMIVKKYGKSGGNTGSSTPPPQQQ